jgi:hypothetical protein
MKSIATFKQETNRALRRAWVTLGIPFDLPMIEEKKDGIIDVEALIICTLLVMVKGRLVTDLPAWVNRYSDLINFQKLKSIFEKLSEPNRQLILDNLDNSQFYTMPKAFGNIFNLRKQIAGTLDGSVRSRITKINTAENVARVSLMIKNRLLYGTGFRADMITLTHVRNISMKGTDMSALLCTNNSTISRILNDLKAGGFLDQDKERIEPFNPYPGIFISVSSVWNLCEMMDATQFSLEELKMGVLENIHFKNDAFGKWISSKLL